MNFIISEDLWNRIENAFFNDNEEILLQEFESIFNDGFIQMDNIKQKLLNLNADVQKNPAKVFATVNKEYPKLKSLNQKFDIFRKSVQDTNQKCIVTIKECQDRETELKLEHIQVEQDFKAKESDMKDLRTRRDKNRTRHNGCVDLIINRNRGLKELEQNITGFMHIIPPALTMLVTTQMLPKTAFTAMYVSGLILGAFRYYSIHCIIKDYEMKSSHKEMVETIDEKIETLKKPLKMNNIDVGNVQWMIENESKKSIVFQDIVKAICNFQIIIRKWQEPLDSISIIFEVNNFSTTPPQNFIERYETSLKDNVSKIMIDAVQLYQKQKFQKFMLPITNIQINRALPAYKFRSRF